MEINLNTNKIPTWCPGCGNHSILHSFKKAVSELNINTHELALFHGIGCSGNSASLLKSYGFHGIHGRAPANAAGAKLTNHRLHVVVFAGDGDLLSEGLTHLVHSTRLNHDITVILHNNGRYGLTTGQTSPTTLQDDKTSTHLEGSPIPPLDPISLLLGAHAGHLIRSFSGDIVHLIESLKKGLTHKGFSLIEVLEPCVIFNKEHNLAWYRERIKKLENIPQDIPTSLAKSQSNNPIYIGEFIKTQTPSYHQNFGFLSQKTLLQQQDKPPLAKLIEELIT